MKRPCAFPHGPSTERINGSEKEPLCPVSSELGLTGTNPLTGDTQHGGVWGGPINGRANACRLSYRRGERQVDHRRQRPRPMAAVALCHSAVVSSISLGASAHEDTWHRGDSCFDRRFAAQGHVLTTPWLPLPFGTSKGARQLSWKIPNVLGAPTWEAPREPSASANNPTP